MDSRMKGALQVTAAAVAIAVGARITLPMVPVPMTLQTLAVLCAGLLLGPRKGLLTGGVYVAMVLVGLPVLADGERAMGLAFLQLKSAGYVVGFAPGAWATGWLGARGGWRHWVGAGILGHAVILACGVPLLAMWLGLPTALSYGLYPFLPGVLVKSVLAAGVVAASRRVRSA